MHPDKCLCRNRNRQWQMLLTTIVDVRSATISLAFLLLFYHRTYVCRAAVVTPLDRVREALPVT